MLPRFVSSILLIIFCYLVIFVFPNWFFTLVVMSFIAVGLYEFFSLVEKKGIPVYKYFGVFVGAMIPLSIYLRFEPTRGWELAFITALCLLLFILQFVRRESAHAIVGVSTTLFAILYVAWFFSFFLKLKLLGDDTFADGSRLVAYLLLVTKSGDMGAYFVGTYFGRHALIARISPKKSVEGAFGGFVFSLAASMLCKFLIPQLEYFHLVILGILLGALAQVGDLSESLIKRDCGVKDSSVFFPGLGGVLDIIDSLLFTAPVFYFYVRILL